MLPLLAALLAAAVAAGVLVIVLQPLLQRYALARPNARSSLSVSRFSISAASSAEI